MKGLATLALAVLVLATGCAGTPQIAPDAQEVVIFEQRPTCPYTSLGPVQARSGVTGDVDMTSRARDRSSRDMQARPEATLLELRQQAHALGANAIVLRVRERFVQERPRPGSSQMRPKSGLAVSGIAIRTEVPPDSRECLFRRTGPTREITIQPTERQRPER